MKSKNKKQIDNKKPPVKESSPKKNEKEQGQEKIENIEEIEKKMYEEQGQEHIDLAPQEKNHAEEQINEKPQKEMLVKPRETYLQEKLSKMACNKNVMSTIKKELEEKIIRKD